MINPKGYLLDTNIVIAALKSDTSVLKQMSQISDVMNLSVISVGELMFGAYKSQGWYLNRNNYVRFINSFKIININADVADTYGLVKSNLQEQGITIGENDLWIASIAIHYQLTLITRDHDFQRIKSFQLNIEAW